VYDYSSIKALFQKVLTLLKILFFLNSMSYCKTKLLKKKLFLIMCIVIIFLSYYFFWMTTYIFISNVLLFIIEKKIGCLEKHLIQSWTFYKYLRTDSLRFYSTKTSKQHHKIYFQNFYIWLKTSWIMLSMKNYFWRFTCIKFLH